MEEICWKCVMNCLFNGAQKSFVIFFYLSELLVAGQQPLTAKSGLL